MEKTLNLIATLEQEEITRLNRTIPAFAPGDTVIVNVNVVEGVYGSYDAHTVVNAKLSYRMTPQVSFGLSLDNLANRQYFDFYKQPGMTGLAEVVVKF